mgnify:CR=1 FL=1
MYGTIKDDFQKDIEAIKATMAKKGRSKSLAER